MQQSSGSASCSLNKEVSVRSCAKTSDCVESPGCSHTGRFTPGEDSQLIAVVRGFPVLYQLSHPYFKNAVKKEKIWDGIGFKLNKTGESCKKRWKSIRDHFMREKKETSGTRKAAKRRKRATYWEKLSFLASVEDERRGLTNAEIDQRVDENNFENETKDGVQPVEEDQQPVTEIQAVEEMSEMEDDPSVKRETGNATQLPINNSRRRPMKRNKNKAAIVKMLRQRMAEKNKIVECVDKLLSLAPKPTENINGLFFKSMAAIVNKLDPRKQALARKKIFAIVSDLELAHFSEYSGSRSGSPMCFSDNSSSTSFQDGGLHNERQDLAPHPWLSNIHKS